MGRNFKKEYDWSAKKYCRFGLFVEKNFGEALKQQLKKDNKTITDFFIEAGQEYLNKRAKFDNLKNIIIKTKTKQCL